MCQLEIYFNTTNLRGRELRHRELKAGTQNRIIFEFFRLQGEVDYTPFEVRYRCGLMNTPITSIRRAMTTLTQMGYLVKTDNRRKGMYDELNYTWKFNGKQNYFIDDGVLDVNT